MIEARQHAERVVRAGAEIPTMVVLGCIFIALTWMGRFFAIEPLGFPTCWPVSGMVLSVLVRRPMRRWPTPLVLFTGLCTIDGFSRGDGALSIATWAAGSSLGPLLGAIVWNSMQGRDTRLNRVDVLVSILIAAVSAALVSGGLMALAMPPSSLPFVDGWLAWSAANGLGTLAVLPLALAPWSRRYWRELGRPRLSEATLALSVLVLEAAVFLGPLNRWRLEVPVFEFLFVPILLWMPLRVGVIGTAISNAFLAAVVGFWADRGLSPFALTAQHHLTHLIELQSLLLAVTSLSLVLALASFERRGARAALRESEERFRRLSDHAPIGIFQADLAGRCLFVNRRWSDLAGMSEMEASGVGWIEVIHPEDRDRVRREWAQAVAGRGEFRSSFRLRPLHGGITWLETRAVPTIDERGEISTYIGTAEDSTARRAIEERLMQLALHDPLTRLANRILLLDRLRQAIARLERERSFVAVLYLDLDRFKSINDDYGHEVGDRVLIEVGQRLLMASRPTDTVGRLGGDEFVIVCPNLRDRNEALRIARRLETALSPPALAGDPPIEVSVSIGIRLAHYPGADPEKLLRDADEAMYDAKRKGRGRSSVSPRIDDRRAADLERPPSEDSPGFRPRRSRLPHREGTSLPRQEDGAHPPSAP